MNKLINIFLIHKKKFIIAGSTLLAIILLIGIIFLVNYLIFLKENSIDVEGLTHGVIINENVDFYKKPKESKWKFIRQFELGENVYIIEEIIDKKSNVWYKIKASDRVGYVKKENVDYFTFNEDEEKSLLTDVSKFNLLQKKFWNIGDFEVFVLKNDINYVYIRSGGRGYGTEGNFYEDPDYKLYIDACDYLGIPYGFYFIDNALNEEELDEEVKVMTEFIEKNKTENNKLPLAIDVEYHDGSGRADFMFEYNKVDEKYKNSKKKIKQEELDARVYRADLIQTLINKFNEKNIDTILYANAKIANEYLSTVNTHMWVAYYDKKQEIPSIWYTETDQEGALNQEFTSKLIGWQFTETGVGKDTNYSVDLSLVFNDFFKAYLEK